MQRFMHVLDDLPSWAFVLGGAVVLGVFEALGALARIQRNVGLLDFAHTALFAGTVVLVISAIRRRQTPVAPTAVHVLGALAGANLFALSVVWLSLRERVTVPLGGVLTAGMASGMWTIVSGLPFALLMLWLSRRYGSHSTVTERRLRVVREVLARKRQRARPAAPPAPDGR